MDTPSPAGMGWPFLVASGRRRDYSILLAPDFLVADLDYGILDTAVRPTAETGPATVIDVRTPGRRRLTLVYATHLLTAADLTAADLTAADLTAADFTAADFTAADLAMPGGIPDASSPDARDEHGRPLRLIYGFASPDAWISTPDEADLTSARSAALDTYRRFLMDEEGAAVTPSYPFLLHSDAIQRPTLRAMASSPALARRSSTDRAPAPRRLAGAAIVAGVAVAGVAVAVVVSGIGRPAPPRVPPDCPSIAATTLPSPATPRPSTSPSPTCLPTP